MTTTTNIDARPRKSLAEQLDRLDAILDGLSEALQGAVADAVQQAVGAAVKQAVEAVLAEVLTNPALRDQLRPPEPPAPAPPAPTRKSKGRGKKAGMAGLLCRVGSLGAACVRRVRQSVGTAGAVVLAAAGLAVARLAPSRLAGAAAWVFDWAKAVAAAAGTVLFGLLPALTLGAA
jgi:hypothetical protein